jgi:hypothetical protein
MRYLVGFVTALALVTSPLSVNAKDVEQDTTSKPNAVEAVPSPEPAHEEPALQLKLDDAGVDVMPPPPRSPDGYTLEEMERRVMRAKVGLGVSVQFIWIGGLLVGIWGGAPGSTSTPGTPEEESSTALVVSGAVVGAGGLGGTIASGILLRQRKRALNELRGTPSRTRLGYTPEEAQLRVKRVRIALGASAGSLALGVALLVAGGLGECQLEPFPSRCDPLVYTGAAFTSAGAVGLITTGFMSLRRTRDRDWLRRADYGPGRRVQGDLAGSRLVF